METLEPQDFWLVVPPKMVVCRLCGESKPVTDFYLRRRRNNSTFVYARCKVCLGKFSLFDLFVRDGGKCAVCAKSVDLESASMDHIVPISRGGMHEWDNIQLTHKACNWKKGNKLMEELE